MTQTPGRFSPLLWTHSPPNSPQPPRDTCYSEEDRQILEKAASILAISVQDLTASRQSFRPPLTIHIPVLGDEDAITNASGNYAQDEELTSPFSWRTGSASSQLSLEGVNCASLIGRLNKEPSNIDIVRQDGLNGDFALFDQAPSSDEAFSWSHVTNQTPNIAKCVDNLMGPLSSEELAEIPGQQFATAMARSEVQLNFAFRDASLDSSALLLHQESTIWSGLSGARLSEPPSVSASRTLSLPAPIPVSNSIQSRTFSGMSPNDEHSGLDFGQAFCWPFPHNFCDDQTGNPLSADLSGDLNLSSHSSYSDDNSDHALLSDQMFQPELDATFSGATLTLQSHPSIPTTQKPDFSDVLFPNDIAREHQLRRSPQANHEIRVRRVQSNGNSTDRQVPSNAMSPARARYQRPLPCDNHQPKRRQPFKDLQKRAETGKMRKVGACVRCKLQRQRCNSNNGTGKPCTRCQSLSKPTLANLPCVRYKITDLRLSDKGQHPQFKWSKRWSSWKMVEIQEWRSPETKTITVTQDVFGGSTMDIVCREFIPIEGDSLQRTWKKDGITLYYPRAPYAIANMKEAGNEIKYFVTKHVASSIRHFIDAKNDELLRSTYAMAYDMVFRPLHFTQNEEARELLQEVFQLWIAIRMESQSERICGQETLGMEPQLLDQNVDTFGTNSISPIMSAQIELITTTSILQPLSRSILRKLQNLIRANRFENWLPIYLCLFILLHSCSILTNDEHRAAKKYGLKTRYVYNAFIEELHMGAKTMIYYFHYCNKGSHPFTKEWVSREHFELAQLNQEQVQFLLNTAKAVQKRRSEFESLANSNDYENDFYFLAQLYDTDWRSKFTI